ncbi:VWA domain-containing protein [Malikia sp.]|uniref:VWA domain-containing protein n=1 Tax=Malikia sp. TaxID=2070706 RepID=UPI00262E877B|nr:VWA domain-containing protein [Malikia sp.]
MSWLTQLLPAAVRLGFKPLKYFVDSVFRAKVVPVPGSVVYCDLWLMVEHSGIHVGDGQISNIVVDGLAESTVSLSGPASFTTKSQLGRKIYVSCDSDGAVGHSAVARRAASHLGERAFYGLVIKNCHQFSTRCVDVAGRAESASLLDRALSMLPDETWEPTMAVLKRAARDQLGATKWRLWDWSDDEQDDPPEPDWQAHEDHFRQLPLNAASIEQIRAELAAARDYEAEIADEVIPYPIRQRLRGFSRTLGDISERYEQVKGFLAACPGADFSHADLQAGSDEFAALAEHLRNNARIRELARQMGRGYISEQRKQQARVPQASRSEVHGTHRSDDLMRMLPSELLHLEDETLETLFYARLLEKNLLTYELSGTWLVNGETTETRRKRTGPVVACLDTSGSMHGAPILKAKALLLAIASILKQEDRSLHLLLFGSAGEIREFSMDGRNDAAGLLKFLQQGFGGGTDFESPLRRALEIIRRQADYLKADVLMISDGDCALSPEFASQLKIQKEVLDCSVYSVLCAGSRVEDGFSNEVVVL